MPATEVHTEGETTESNHYEFAYHVLPTVAEGEVASVVEVIKSHITNGAGTITTEEAPQRIDLAYEIVKPIDGTNRRFRSAYFGWVRFTAAPEVLAELTEELEGTSELLRSITIKLTRAEEAEPFYYHEALANQKQVSTIEDDSVAPAPAPREEPAKEGDTDTSSETETSETSETDAPENK